MTSILWVGFAGAVGAITRVVLGQFIYSESGFPIVTLLVNIVGTFVLCFLVKGACRKLRSNNKLQDAITTGFLGSFTTFSALSMETIMLIESEQFVMAMVYVGLSIVGGLAAGAFGLYLGGKKVQP